MGRNGRRGGAGGGEEGGDKEELEWDVEGKEKRKKECF